MRRVVGLQCVHVYARGVFRVLVAAPGVPSVHLLFSETEVYTKYFALLDTDRDGFLTGADIRDLFLQTQLPPQILSAVRIIPLCVCVLGGYDTDQIAGARREAVSGAAQPVAGPHRRPR